MLRRLRQLSSTDYELFRSFQLLLCRKGLRTAIYHKGIVDIFCSQAYRVARPLEELRRERLQVWGIMSYLICDGMIGRSDTINSENISLNRLRYCLLMLEIGVDG